MILFTFGKINHITQSKIRIMDYIDILIGIALAYGLIRGLMNGFFIELASLVSLIIGIWAAIKFSYVAKSLIGGVVSWTPRTIQIVAFIVTFILVVIAITILAKFLTAAANLSGLGLVNKIFGGVFGVIKTILILSVILNLFARLNFKNLIVSKETTEKSLFYSPILKAAAWLYNDESAKSEDDTATS